MSTTWAIYDLGTKTFMELGKKLKFGNQRSDAEIVEFIYRATGVLSVRQDGAGALREMEDGWAEVNPMTFPDGPCLEEKD